MKKAATELELRVEFARRRDERDQKRARALCAVDSEHCRAGDEWEWFDISIPGRTYCFCPAHALAAELLGPPDYFDACAPVEIIERINACECLRAQQKARGT